ncbi:MAG: hypothetical protein U0Q22_13145 [Acidimicrobiales bacterium]
MSERIEGLRADRTTWSGYALLLSSVVTSVLGLGYWFVTARLFDAAELGRATALVSAMLLVTSLGTAGLKRGLIRFVPVAGPGTARFVRHVYAVGLAATLVLVGVFLTGIGGWSDGIPMFRSGVGGIGLFAASAAIWGVFALQDPVLIGAGRSTVVPAENTAFSVGKIVVVLVGSAFLGAELSVLLSWVVPAFAATVWVNWLLFRRRFPEMAATPATERLTVVGVVRFAGGEYVAALAWLGAVYLTPLIVLDRAGATANAHFYIAFQIGYALFLVSSNITDALVAHSAEAPHELWNRTRTVCRHLTLLLVPAVGLTLVAAPWIMGVFGDGYRDGGSGTLRLLALAAVPNTITTVMIAIAHARREIWLVVVTQVTMAAATVIAELALVGAHGIDGVATGWVIAQTIAAVVAVALTFRPGRGGPDRGGPGRGGPT